MEGKIPYTFTWAEGRQVNGYDWLEGEWPWREHPWEARVRYVRVQAKSPTYGAVTVVMVDEPGQDRCYLLCLETTRSGPVLIQRWRRRHWIECVLRGLKHLLVAQIQAQIIVRKTQRRLAEGERCTYNLTLCRRMATHLRDR